MGAPRDFPRGPARDYVGALWNARAWWARLSWLVYPAGRRSSGPSPFAAPWPLVPSPPPPPPPLPPSANPPFTPSLALTLLVRRCPTTARSRPLRSAVRAQPRNAVVRSFV
jgi:hypothetical protein